MESNMVSSQPHHHHHHRSNTTTTMTTMNHHHRHHSLNSISVQQLSTTANTGTLPHPKTILQPDPVLSPSPSCCTLTMAQTSNVVLVGGRHYHCHHLVNNQLSGTSQTPKWTLVEPELMAIAICNYQPSKTLHLDLKIGDVLVIVERFGSEWFRGYHDHDSSKLGVFPANHVQVFDDNLRHRFSDSSQNSMLFYQYTLLDPLYLQVVRTLREWHYHLVIYYRTNACMEKFLIVRNLIYELLEMCSTLSKDLAPSLWRRRGNQLLKINSDPKDPFANPEDQYSIEEHATTVGGGSVFDSSLEDLYDRILAKLNQGNQHLNLDIMPSLTNGTFHFDTDPKFHNFFTDGGSIKRRNKFMPFYVQEHCKYLPYILDYYNHINRGFNQKFKSNISSAPVTNRQSFSFGSGSSSPNHLFGGTTGSATANNSSVRKFRRHLLFGIREASFSNLPGASDSDQLQIEVYILRCNGDSDTSYEVLTEKFCYRARNGSTKTISNSTVNQALFLDVLSKRSPQNGLSTNRFHQSQHSDASNYYLIVQLWRYGKVLVNEKKNMLSGTTGSLSTGSSVFHTISSTSISSASATISSFVSNGWSNNSDKSKDNNSSGTPDSSSIDSSEFGVPHFKRSVGFSVIPLLELVSRDKEIRPSAELFQNDGFLRKILFSDDAQLLPVPVKLYEGDLTVSVLEMMLKHRQALSSMSSLSSGGSLSSSSVPSSISKLTPLGNNYQLVVCAKFISELMVKNSDHKRLSNCFTIGNQELDIHQQVPQLSLADHLLLTKDGEKVANMPNLVLVQKRSFGDLITAGHFRNDFYLTLDSAEFEKGGKTIPKNIEVSVCLITENGVHERAISSGVNSEPVTIYRSHIQYHQNSPKWFEHIKVNVPLELFETAHLRFMFCHCSSKERERKFLGFSFLPLADQNGACLSDGDHELYIYKCESERKLDDPGFYLAVPWGQNEKSSSARNSSSSISLSSNSSSSSSSLAAASTLITSRSSKEVFHLKSHLISSKLTQNSEILSLLKWSSNSLEQVYDSLQRIGRVPGEEMVKFLEDILDALFALFTTTTANGDSQQSQTTLIFRVIVDFFKTLNDPKFISYRSALDKYIENQFSAPLVYSGLMSCVKQCIKMVISTVQQDSTSATKRELEFILRCVSVFDWILKIVVQSRILYIRASDGGSLMLLEDVQIQSDEDFKTELLDLFGAINRLLAVECKSSDDYLIVAIQESVLGAMPNAFGYLSQILSPAELAKLVQTLVHLGNHGFSLPGNGDWPSPSSSVTPTNCMPSSSGKKSTIINAKLMLLKRTIQFGYVWSNHEARIELLDTFIRMLIVCISESKFCLHILRDVILYLIENTAGFDLKVRPVRRSVHSKEKEIEMLSIGAIDVIVEHITGMVTTTFDLLPFTKLSSHHSINCDDGDYLGSMIICLLVLLDFMTLKNYEKLFEKRSTDQCKELILNIFAVFLNALYYFPDNWLEIRMAVNRIILHSLTMLRAIMSQRFLADRFDETIWRMYFKLAIALLTQQRLQLESQHHWKRKLILNIYGCDMRMEMGFELVACWELIGPYKISFIPGMVSSFVDVTLVPELELRKATIPIFYDMIAVDYSANGNFKQVEAALIDKLDVVAHKSECDSQFKELFTQILTERIESEKPVWHQDGLRLVKSISRLLSFLIDYRQELRRRLTAIKSVSASVQSMPATTPAVDHHCGGCFEVDDRLLICTYTLLRFFRDEIESNNRKSIMLRYLEKLTNVHTLLGNYAEAAFTLKLQADQLSWQSPTEAQKKESICQTMVDYFEKGQCWEEGIKVCKDLQDVYERSYKYAKLSTILKRSAELLDKILTQHRSDNEYFRVSFYGLDFPTFLQNSTFIFRGLEFEKISAFTHRIQKEFPSAQLLTKVVPTDENITESHCQYIQIFSVKPIPEPPVTPEQSLILGPPDPVLGYYNTNSVRQFIQDRPIPRAPFDPNNEFKSLWIERTTYTTEQPLPGMLRMFKVTATLVTYLSPIENACETIKNKNDELKKLISMYSNEGGRPESISPLSMRLQGILDAAVNGGIAKYIEAFLGSEFLTANPDQIPNVSTLKDRIANQIQIVEAGLTLHGRLAPTPVRPLHTRLLERFSTMRTMVHQANIETSQALLWAPSTAPILHRPSILSQPLPPIPGANSNNHHYRHHTDTISDPDTSSISSSSSSQTTNLFANDGRPLRSPAPPPPPPPPYAQSPGSKSLKNKPLPPLPPDANGGNGTISPSPAVKRHSSNAEKHKARPIAQDNGIYSVPGYTDLVLLDNESSVDDSLDYCDVNVSFDSSDPAVNQNNNSRINRSLSIPCSAMSMYYGNGLNQATTNPDLVADQGKGKMSPPPPLPPRTANLDRSNSLNSSVRPTCPPPPPPPMMPPALPQRPVKKVSTNGHLNGNGSLTPKSDQPEPANQTSNFLDGLEFENLVLSSPTPTNQTQTGGRPAPIIGIEINNNDNGISDPLSLSALVSDATANTKQQHVAKSNSLPRVQQFVVTPVVLDNQNNHQNDDDGLNKDPDLTLASATVSTPTKSSAPSAAVTNSSLLD